ncbi:hypothetical protein MSG28_013773 [Choristoneura fumiferana]|uniref:Uncharacterized protein n=1 Tax=Choristoneura fumiferana TaxID=7141 RepID=A0ACC0K9E0_CHOFU|nr:hypothetical protein MSG28_013773 [Choristoneura fumiferana]
MMEVDNSENSSSSSHSVDAGKFANLKAFVNAARDFEATHSESSANLMNRYLGEISYGIKISWQESYLANLMKQLTEWIIQPFTDQQMQLIGHRSLTVLVNVCYGNLPAVYALMRAVDTKNFVVHLISLKDGGYGGVDVCRLLLCLSAATRGAGAMRQADVNSYLTCAMRTFSKATVDKDATQLLHAYTFMKDLCDDSNLRNLVTAYPNFTTGLKDALKNLMEFCHAPGESMEPEQVTACVQNAFKFLTVLISLDLYALRKYHCQMLCLCLIAHRLCLPESLELFAAVVLQYKEEGQLPQELIVMIGDGLTGLLVPPALEPGKAGLQWLQVVGALCETGSTQERVLQNVTPDSYEDTLYSVLLYTSQNGPVGLEQAQQAAIVACRTALTLASLSQLWDAALKRFLAHHQVRKSLCAGLSSTNGARRKEVLQLIKHHCFPTDQMEEVFGESLSAVPESSSQTRTPADGEGEGWDAPRLAPAQEKAVDALVKDLADALRDNKISDIATSSVMELYGYKMTCLEQRLHSHSVALQGASEHMASLQHSLALLQATNSSQQDVLYTTQMQNEKHKKTIENLHKQLDDAEVAVRGFRAKVVAEKHDKEKQKEHLQNEFKNQLNTIENEMKGMEKEFENKLKKAEQETKSVQKLLEQETNKNNELSTVLIKFEERVQLHRKEMEEANALERSLRKEIDHKDMTIKHLEKTILERENRLYQLSTQLEEMKRVQEMVAKLMSKSAAASPNNST